jgi:hypothetical protein
MEAGTSRIERVSLVLEVHRHSAPSSGLRHRHHDLIGVIAGQD